MPKPFQLFFFQSNYKNITKKLLLSLKLKVSHLQMKDFVEIGDYINHLITFIKFIKHVQII